MTFLCHQEKLRRPGAILKVNHQSSSIISTLRATELEVSHVLFSFRRSKPPSGGMIVAGVENITTLSGIVVRAVRCFIWFVTQEKMSQEKSLYLNNRRTSLCQPAWLLIMWALLLSTLMPTDFWPSAMRRTAEEHEAIRKMVNRLFVFMPTGNKQQNFQVFLKALHAHDVIHLWQLRSLTILKMDYMKGIWCIWLTQVKKKVQVTSWRRAPGLGVFNPMMSTMWPTQNHFSFLYVWAF